MFGCTRRRTAFTSRRMRSRAWFAVGGRRNEQLERDVLPDLAVARRVDDRHTAAAELPPDLEPPGEQRPGVEIAAVRLAS